MFSTSVPVELLMERKENHLEFFSMIGSDGSDAISIKSTYPGSKLARFSYFLTCYLIREWEAFAIDKY